MTAAKPYYADDLVTLWLGDCRTVTDWLTADVLVTDPPYGRGWKQGRTRNDGRHADDSHKGITGDEDTGVRDAALAMWGTRPGVVFGDFMLPPPPRRETSSRVSQARRRRWPRGDGGLPA